MNFNRKILNWSVIITLLIAYVVPGRSTDRFGFEFGYPFGFFTMYNIELQVGDTILNSTLFNILGFVLNILVIYLIFNTFNKVVNRRSEKID
ncbi:hypothetical protein [Clostridium sp.]|uniref:hypothetical protein n=1 Tax=Clostridium sp. TaxID=1506 RepID=UPI003F3261DD